MDQPRPYLGMSARERLGVFIFMLLSLGCVGLFYLITYLVPKPKHPAQVDWHRIDSLNALLAPDTADNDDAVIIRLHPFDPNTEDSVGLLTLGFSPRLAHSLLNYRRHKGVFKVKSHLGKLYGIDSALLTQIQPYNLLPDTLPKKQYANTYPTYVPRPEPTHADINEVDTNTLNTWPTIGMGTAKRIVLHRQRLGGFVDTSQYQEVWGLMPDQLNTLKRLGLLDADTKPIQIYLNRVSETQLRQHPYINFKQAKLLCAYRLQYGPYKALDEVLRSKALTPAELVRLRPYLSLEY